MILLIDNYDSFTWNLASLIGSREPDLKVIRNDACSIQEIEEMNPDGIVISPGPGRPEEAGNLIEVIRHFKERIPILGVCLGHQAIGLACGARIGYARELKHGKKDRVQKVKPNHPLFRGLEDGFEAGRYHSLAVMEEGLPDELEVTARAADGEIMGICHRDFPVFGIQFHPESILTPKGDAVIRNFLEIAGKRKEGELK